MENRACEDFDNMAFWSELVADVDVVDVVDEQAVLDLNGEMFQNSTTPAGEVDVDGVGVQKQNFTVTCDRSPFINSVLLQEVSQLCRTKPWVLWFKQ